MAKYLLRRVAPDARKLDLKDVAKRALSLTILKAMGHEIGSIHASHKRAGEIVDDLAQRDTDWLHVAAEKAQVAVEKDYQSWLAVSAPEKR